MHFCECEVLYFDSNFTEVCSLGPTDNCQHWLGNGLAPNRRRAITWSNAEPVGWRISAALRGDELNTTLRVIWFAYLLYDETCFLSYINQYNFSVIWRNIYHANLLDIISGLCLNRFYNISGVTRLAPASSPSFGWGRSWPFGLWHNSSPERGWGHYVTSPRIPRTDRVDIFFMSSK